MVAGYEKRIAEAARALMQRVQSRLGALDGKTKLKLKYIQHAMQARLASLGAVLKGEHDRDLEARLRYRQHEHDHVRAWQHMAVGNDVCDRRCGR